MTAILDQDWSFKHIERSDRERAARLEAASPPDALVKELDVALHEAIDHNHVRIAVDSKRNSFVERRAIVQFRISRALYDWFFNARTGYRSRFWIDPRTGIALNESIVATLNHTLERRLAPTIAARRIDVFDERGSRTEKDGGAVAIQREEMVKSLSPNASKIWICERLYS